MPGTTHPCETCGVHLTDPTGWSGAAWYCDTCSEILDAARPVFSTPAEDADIEALIDSLCDGGAR